MKPLPVFLTYTLPTEADKVSLEREFYATLHHGGEGTSGFENCWPYILQATRNGLHTYRYDDAIVYYTKRFPQVADSATIIVHAVGSNRREAIRELTKREHARGTSVRVKNVPVSEYAWWQKRGYIQASKAWDEYTHYDDNSYPQYVNEASVIRNGDYCREYRKVIRRFSARRTIVTETYETYFDGAALQLLDVFAQRMHEKRAASYREALRAHLFFFDATIHNKVRLQHLEHGALLGWSFLTIVDSVVHYNALVNRTEDDLQKYLTHEAKRWMVEHYPQVKWIIQQGSETEGQDYMKRRFGSPEALHKVHLEYVG